MKTPFNIPLSRPSNTLLLLLIISVFIHLFYFYQYTHSPYQGVLLGDAEAYHQKAVKLINEGWLGDSVFYQAPLYPYFVAFLYELFAQDVVVIQYLQILLSLANTLLAYRISCVLFDNRTGLVSAFISVFYGAYIFYSVLLLKVTLSIFFTSLLIYVLIEFWRTSKKSLLFFSGILLGVNICLRGNYFLVFPGILLWLVWVNFSKPLSEKLGYIGIFILGVALSIAPVTTRNYAVGNDFVLTSYQGGANFYLGNNKNATGHYTVFDFLHPTPRFEENNFKNQAELLAGKKLKPSEISGFWFSMAMKFIADDPGKFFLLNIKRTFLLFNDFEAPDNYDYSFMKTLTPALSLGFISFGPLVICSFLGVFLFGKLSPKFGLLYIFFGSYFLSVALFYVTSRYRLPLVPALIPFAAVFIAQGWPRIVALKRFNVIPVTGLFLITATLAFKNISHTDFDRSRLNMGYAHELNKDFKQAEIQYKKVLNENPSHPEAHLLLGMLFKKTARPAKAIAEFKEAVHIQPEFLEGYFQLARIYYDQGSYEKARAAYMKIIKANANDARAHANLGFIYFLQGKTEEGIRHNQTALNLKPNLGVAHYNLGFFYSQMEQHEESRYHFIKAREYGQKVDEKFLNNN